MLVNVTLPVYNEEFTLAHSVAVLDKFLSSQPAFEYEIFIVDNGSTDRTNHVAIELWNQYRNLRVRRLLTKGRGLALKLAWKASDADILTYMDIDLSTDLRAFPIMIEALANGNYDLATGSRLLPLSDTTRSLKREILSQGYNHIVRSMFNTNLSDFQCGFKAITRRSANFLLPMVKDDGWFFDTELLLKAVYRGRMVLDMPVKWTEDPDSRVKIIPTAIDDLKGLVRVKRELAIQSRERSDWKNGFRGWF